MVKIIYLHHFSIATGSLMELETHLLIAERSSYCQLSDLEPVLNLSAEISHMLGSLTQKLKEKRP
ncbi:MAG: four helix bundle protein [Cyanobacteriota bacterium SKYGB_h_bin112]|nr:four helix bundle protein [Cyanobacteriota bacterium SKYGB_h_bin112]